MCNFIRAFTIQSWDPVIHSVVSNISVCGQWRPWSDCADAQADLDIRCPHMSENMFSHGVVELIDDYKIIYVPPLRVIQSEAGWPCTGWPCTMYYKRNFRLWLPFNVVSKHTAGNFSFSFSFFFFFCFFLFYFLFFFFFFFFCFIFFFF